MADIYAGGGRPLRTRMDLCSELFVLRKTIVSAGDSTKHKVRVMAGRRVQAIRGVLLGRAGLTLADEMLTPGFAESHLLNALESVKDKPRHEQVATAAYAKGIMKTLGAIQGAERRFGAGDGAIGFSDELVRAADALLPGDGNYGDKVDPVIDHCIGAGAFGDELRSELVAAKLGGTKEDEYVDSFVKMKAAAYDKVLAEREVVYRKYREGNVADLEANYAEYQKFLDEVFAPVESARNEVIMAERQKASNAFARVGKKLIATVMDKSPIAQDDAVKWANAQEVTKQAVARLKKIGYPLESLRADMAEFYRFTGGRLAAVKIHSKGDKRANATDIEAHSKVGTVNMDANFTKRTLWHEMAHHMEADPVAKMAAGRFIRRRSVDGKKYSLRSLSGNSGYRKDEAAFNGNFFSPYVGKVYADGVTEVFSMGVESFSNAETLARRAVDDPQTLEFIAGFVKAPLDPLAKAHMTLREITATMQTDLNEAIEGDLDSLLKGLADTVEITPDTDTSWVGQNDWQLSRFKQIGRFGDSGYYLLAGKVTAITSRRKMNGLVLARVTSSGWVERSEIPGTDQTVIKAMVAIYQKTGAIPNYYLMNDINYIRKQLL